MCLWIPDYSEDWLLIAWINFKQKHLIVRLIVFSNMLMYECLRALNRSPTPSFPKLSNSWRTSYFHFSKNSIGKQFKEKLIYYFHCAFSNTYMMNLQNSNVSDPLTWLPFQPPDNRHYKVFLYLLNWCGFLFQ